MHSSKSRVKRSDVGDFAFDETVANGFDEMVVRSVPLYSELQRMTVELAGQFAQPNTEVVDLGCSTGVTLDLLDRAIGFEGVQLVGVDNSEPMLEKARARLRDTRLPVRLICEDLNAGLPTKSPSVVIMNWTLQFIRPLQRDSVIREIYDRLVPNGCLIVMEKVLCDSSLLNRLYIDLYYDFKKREGFSDSEIAQKRESLENVLIPYRVEENLALFQRNGFEIVDVFFRWFNWAGFLAVKRPPTTSATA